MADSQNRYRILYLYLHLVQESDRNHTIPTSALAKYLEETYGIAANRLTLTRDMQVLCTFMNCKMIRSSQNRYYYDGRPFSSEELKLLMEAVQTSRFVTEDECTQLTEKLSKLADPFEETASRTNLKADFRYPDRAQLCAPVLTALNQAMDAGKKVTFQYLTYDTDKRRGLKDNGAVYTLSPYALTWDGDYYYVIGWCDHHKTIQTFRLDRMAGVPKVTGRRMHAKPKDFDVAEYHRGSIRMYHGKPAVEVDLVVNASAMDSLIDHFGLNVETKKIDENSAEAKVLVSPGPTFYRWVFGFAGDVRITGPKEILNEYREMAEKAVQSAQASEAGQ